MQCACLRWAVSLKQVFESDALETHFRRAAQAVQPEEWDRIKLFKFRDDALSSLIGRLMLRQATKKITGRPWSEITFGRTERGKPYLLSPSGFNFGINVSHQGDYVVLSSSCTPRVGVDVMCIERDKTNKTADEYITFMQRSYSKDELRVMRMQPTDTMKLTYFYRFWCLKESIIKATGVGIHDDLAKLDFRMDPNDRYRPGCLLSSTKLMEGDRVKSEWVFEESFLDQLHCVAVCREAIPSIPTCRLSQGSMNSLHFAKVNLEMLLNDCEVLNRIDGCGAATEWLSFFDKPRKPW
uniref:L-aminoadipate-semialdehyde dehydrogenase-phosphopantetheinyl transferase n=1 Tax=Plectus sambesii TaxID=2011161 RepID=A0A914UHW5_9BILA